MMDPETLIPRKSTLFSSGVTEETITDRTIDEEVAPVILEAVGSRMSAQGLTLDAMLERLMLLEPLMIGTAQEEMMVDYLGIESDEAWAKVTVDSHSRSTNSLTGIVDFTVACLGLVLGQERDTNNDRRSATAHATFRRMETIVPGTGVSSIASDGSLVINSDVAKDGVSENPGCGRPLACTALQRQEELEEGAIISSRDVQSTPTDSAQQNIEKEKSTPGLMPIIGGDERPGDGTTLGTTGSVDLPSAEVEKGNTSTSSPPVRSGRGRSSMSVSEKDKHGHPIATLSSLVDQAPSMIDKGRLKYAAGGGCNSPGFRHKQPGTKRNRVARSEKNASLRVDFTAPVDGHEKSAIKGASNDPLPRVAGHSQNKQKVSASKYTRQKPDTNTNSQPTHGSQAFELLQLSISEARAQCQCKKDRHSHGPRHFDSIEQGRGSLASEQPRDEGRQKRRVGLDQGVETPFEQLDGNISKSKQKRMKARMRIANGPGGETKDSTKQSARTRAKGCLAMNSDHGNGPISTAGRGVVVSVASDADVRSIRCCTTTDIEINAPDRSKAGSLCSDADENGNKRAAKTPQASSTFKAKERYPNRRHKHTGKVPTPIEHANGSGDGRSKAISKDYEGSAGVMVQEGESVLAGSDSRRENSHCPSPRHQRLSSILIDHHNPNILHTGSESHRSNKAPTTTTTSAQASRMRRRANKTSTASGHQPGAGGRIPLSPRCCRRNVNL